MSRKKKSCHKSKHKKQWWKVSFYELPQTSSGKKFPAFRKHLYVYGRSYSGVERTAHFFLKGPNILSLTPMGKDKPSIWSFRVPQVRGL